MKYLVVCFIIKELNNVLLHVHYSVHAVKKVLLLTLQEC